MTPATPCPITLQFPDAIPVYRVELVRERDAVMPTISDPQTAATVAWSFAERSDRELFIVLLMATDNSLIGAHVAHVGTLSASVVSAREVFKPAILANAASVIVAHNHPSGNLEPSREDLRISRQLKAAGDMLGIPVLDSVIVSHRGSTSLAERGVL
jgi:DNA repair protein RadC